MEGILSYLLPVRQSVTHLMFPTNNRTALSGNNIQTKDDITTQQNTGLNIFLIDDNKKQEHNTNTIFAISGIQPHTTKLQPQHSEDQQNEDREPFYGINKNPETLNVTQTVASQIPEQMSIKPDTSMIDII